MTKKELHEILDDESRKLTVDELKEVIFHLKNDCIDALSKYFGGEVKAKEEAPECHYYRGEINAFYICLDLLEHINYENKEQQK